MDNSYNSFYFGAKEAVYRLFCCQNRGSVVQYGLVTVIPVAKTNQK